MRMSTLCNEDDDDSGSEGNNCTLTPTTSAPLLRDVGEEGESVQELARKRSESFHRSREQNPFAEGKVVYCSGRNLPDSGEDAEEDLQFSADFECGNLFRVLRISKTEYDFEVRPDCGNDKHTTAWFYFSVCLPRARETSTTYVFNITNLVKANSLYNMGLRPCCYMKSWGKWVRYGEKVCYFRNSTSCVAFTDFHVLSFEVRLSGNCPYYFAQCFPFAYSDLCLHLSSLSQVAEGQRAGTGRSEPAVIVKRKVLCLSKCGRSVERVKLYADKSVTRYIAICARVHPGEVNSSWVCKGAMDYLLSEAARPLLKQYKFVFFPMLNPDGVVLGHYRADSDGVDLNRVWQTPSPVQHPTIYAVKRYLQKLQSKGTVSIFFDLHGHSRKKDVFMYGNNDRLKGCHIRSPAERINNYEKLLPHLFAKACPQFAFAQCTYHIAGVKEGTARVVVWDELGVTLAYTVETSFLLSSAGAAEASVLEQYEQVGVALIRVIHEFTSASDETLHLISKDVAKLLTSPSEVPIAVPSTPQSPTSAGVVTPPCCPLVPAAAGRRPHTAATRATKFLMVRSPTKRRHLRNQVQHSAAPVRMSKMDFGVGTPQVVETRSAALRSRERPQLSKPQLLIRSSRPIHAAEDVIPLVAGVSLKPQQHVKGLTEAERDRVGGPSSPVCCNSRVISSPRRCFTVRPVPPPSLQLTVQSPRSACRTLETTLPPIPASWLLPYNGR